MKRHKFRALVTLDPARSGSKEGDPLGHGRALVVRACHHKTHCGKVFRAVVTPDDEAPRQPDTAHAIVNVLLLGDDVPDYLAPGDHFDLWLGTAIGHGVVSRQEIPCW